MSGRSKGNGVRHFKSRVRAASGLLLASSCFTTTICAQKPVFFDYGQASDRQQPLQWTKLPAWLAWDMQLRGRTEGQTSNNQVSENDRVYELTRVRGGLTVKPTSFLRGYLQFQDTHALGLPVPQQISNQRDAFDLFQGYLDIHAADLDVVTGRQQLRYGSERLVGISDWTNNSRSWDGFDAHLGSKNWLEAFATSVVTMHPTSLDKHGAGLTFYGVVGTLTTVVPRMQIQAFEYIRRVRSVASQQGIAGGELEHTFGAEVNGDVKKAFFYDALGSLQRGSYSNDSIHGGAGYAKAGYQLTHVPWRPRFTGEYDYATGNPHTNAGRIETFDQQYPSNHNAFGLTDTFGFQNIAMARASVDLAPKKNFTLLFQTESWKVASLRDSVYAGAGTVLVKVPTAGFTANDIGQGFDASGAYRIKEYLLVQAGVGHIFPGRVLAQNGKAPPLTLGYLQLTYRFKVTKQH